MGQHLDGGWLRRGSMVAASLLAASGLLAACGSSSTKAASTTSSSASSKPVTITFMQRESTSVLKPYLVHLTDEFNSTHKDIKVELEFEPSENVVFIDCCCGDTLSQQLYEDR
jgi:ABC-type glycerol-3-phosphate transport system substrate-binding protein